MSRVILLSLQRNVLNKETYDDILVPLTQRERNVKLMQHLMACGSEAYEFFKNVLKLKYDFVYKEMDKMESCKHVQ